MTEQENRLLNQKTANKKIDVFLQFLMDFFNFKKTLKTFLIIVLLFLLNVGGRYPVMSESSSVKIINIEKYDEVNYPLMIRMRFHEKLVNEVEKYIKANASASEINSELLVTLCQKYNLDIMFVLAQGLLESQFGTKGKALVTKSLFNVGAYDNGKVKCKYKNINESIEPYMKLLREQYLVNKEIVKLIQDRGYKDIDGCRFATSLVYEQRLRTLMINIDMQTSIKMYQEIAKLDDEQIIVLFGPIKNEQLNITTQL